MTVPRSFIAHVGPTLVSFGPRTRVVPLQDVVGPVFVVHTPGRTEQVREVVASLGEVTVFPRARQHVPRSTVDEAAQALEQSRAATVVAVGGGSAIGLAKALALRFERLRKIYVPTTFSGSEMTNIWGTTDDGRKTTGRDERVRADRVFYDPELVATLGLGTVYPSLFNAMAHAVEAVYSPGVYEGTAELALEALRVLTRAIRDLAAGNDDLVVRADALYGAYLAGRALDDATMGIQHKLAHVLGGLTGAEHAAVHTVLLPHTLEFNREWVPEGFARMTEALGADPVVLIHELQRQAGVPTTLSEAGLRGVALDAVAREVARGAYHSPRPAEVDDIVGLLERCR